MQPILSDIWKFVICDTQGKYLPGIQYTSPVLKKFFNVSCLRNGMTLCVNSDNYSLMPLKMKNLFIDCNLGTRRQVELNKINYENLHNPSCVLDLNVVLIKFWLIHRDVFGYTDEPDKKNI